MQEIIRSYFQCWLDNNIDVVKEIFAEDIVYSECYGPEYHGINQILRWFTDWNEKGTVLKWDIKEIIQVDNTVIVEWFFQCNYDDVVDEFDGVTIAKFTDDMKICNLKEFQSKAEHCYPYED